MAAGREQTLYTVTTPFADYQVVDMLYEGRPGRVLFSSGRSAAQSGVAKDGKADLLFDYNQRFFELATSLKPKRMLLIGGGAYTLPTTLLKALPSLLIDVVEPDAALDDIAARFFGLKPTPRLRLIHQDGHKYLQTHSRKYDLIVMDAFNGTTIPSELTAAPMARELIRHLTPSGVVAINMISAYYGRNANLIREQYAHYITAFETVEIFPANHSLLSFWLPQNFVLVAQRSGMHQLELRYAALEPPQLEAS